MQKTQTIKRRSKSDDPNENFMQLKAWGIEWAQEISGHHWTDYNSHDPGVTILEQLCFALTELDYQSQFPIEDYLCDAQNTMDYPQFALHAPEVILGSHPVTAVDYRNALLDQLPKLDALTVTLDPTAGLYHLALRPNQYPWQQQDTLSSKDASTLINDVTNHFNRLRNIAEDIGVIKVCRPQPCQLQTLIDIEPGTQVARTIAQCYISVEHFLGGGVEPQWYQEYPQKELDYVELWQGPTTYTGIYPDYMTKFCTHLKAIPGLADRIASIPGVKNVHYLNLSAEQDTCEDGFRIVLPESTALFGVKIQSQGQTIQVDRQMIENELKQLYFQRATRRSQQRLGALHDKPQGQYHEFSQYHCIQGQFPRTYGLPPAASLSQFDQSKGNKQLAGYLLIFDQLMANFAGNLAGIRSLFSTQLEDEHSYWMNPLTDQHLPGASLLFNPDCASDDPNDQPRSHSQSASQALEQRLGAFDDYWERKGRVLDYLLALHGEVYPQEILAQFDYYHFPQDRQRVFTQALSDYVNAIVALTRDRCGAMDHHAGVFEHCELTGFAKRLAFLLGLKQKTYRSLLSGLIMIDLPWEDTSSSTHDDDVPLLKLVYTGDDHQAFITVQRLEAFESLEAHELRQTFAQYFSKEGHLVNSELFRYGVHLDRYRLLKRENEANSPPHFDALCHLGDDQDQANWWYIATFNDLDTAHQAINCLRNLLVQANQGCEGFHIVEHILLRPYASPEHRIDGQEIAADFYPLTMTVVFPDWTRRCFDQNFQRYTEQTLYEQAPAHLKVNLVWLDPKTMQDFETRFSAWNTAFSQRHHESDVADECDQKANSLIRFLLAHIDD